jgi:hypothetical protein
MTEQEARELYLRMQSQQQGQPGMQPQPQMPPRMSVDEARQMYSAMQIDKENALDDTANRVPLLPSDDPFQDFVRGFSTGLGVSLLGMPADTIANLVQGAGAVYGLLTGPSIEDIASGKAKAPEELGFVSFPRERIPGTTENIQSIIESLTGVKLQQQGISPSSSVAYATGQGIGGALSFRGLQTAAQAAPAAVQRFAGAPLDSAKALLAEAALSGGTAGLGATAAQLAGDTTVAGVPIAPLVSAATEFGTSGAIQGVASVRDRYSPEARRRAIDEKATEVLIRQFGAPTVEDVANGLSLVDMPTQQYNAIREELIQMVDAGMQVERPEGLTMTTARAIELGRQEAGTAGPFSAPLSVERLLLDNPRFKFLRNAKDNNVTGLVDMIGQMNPDQGARLMATDEVRRAIAAEAAARRASLSQGLGDIQVDPDAMRLQREQANNELDTLLEGLGKGSNITDDQLGKVGRQAFDSAYASMRAKVNAAYDSIVSEQAFPDPSKEIMDTLKVDFGENFMANEGIEVDRILSKLEPSSKTVISGQGLTPGLALGSPQPTSTKTTKVVDFKSLNSAMRELTTLRLAANAQARQGIPGAAVKARAAKKALGMLSDHIETIDPVAAGDLKAARALRMQQGITFESGPSADVIALGKGSQTKLPDEVFFRGYLNSGKVRDVEQFMALFGDNKAAMAAANQWMSNQFLTFIGPESSPGTIRRKADAFLNDKKYSAFFRQFPEMRQRVADVSATAGDVYTMANRLANYSDAEIAARGASQAEVVDALTKFENKPYANMAAQHYLADRFLQSLLKGTDESGNALGAEWKRNVANFKRSYSQTLKAFPDVQKQFDKVLASARSAEEFQSYLKNSVVRHFVEGGDAEAAVKAWLSSNNKRVETAELAELIKTNPQMKPLLRNAMFEHMFTAAGGNSPDLRTRIGEIRKFTQDDLNKDIIKTLVSSEDIKKLDNLDKFILLEQRLEKARTAGSQTAPQSTILAELESYGIGMVSNMLRRFTMLGLQAAGGAPATVAGQAAGDIASARRQARLEKEKNLATEVYSRMLADPATFKLMLERHPKKDQPTVKEQLSRSLNATLQRMAVQSAVTSAMDQRRLQERERRLAEIEQSVMQEMQ